MSHRVDYVSARTIAYMYRAYLDEAFDDVEGHSRHPADDTGHPASTETSKHSAAVSEPPVSSAHSRSSTVLYSTRYFRTSRHSLYIVYTLAGWVPI